MALKGRQYTVTAAAVAPLALPANGVPTNTQPGHIPIQEISFKAAAGNAGTIYIGNSDVTAVPANALIALPANQGFTTGPYDNGPEYADDFYVVGTANDTVFIYVQPR